MCDNPSCGVVMLTASILDLKLFLFLARLLAISTFKTDIRHGSGEGDQRHLSRVVDVAVPDQGVLRDFL